MDLQASKTRQSSRGYVTFFAFVCFALAGGLLISKAITGGAEQYAAPVNQVSASSIAMVLAN